jgi:hypothetical protein
VVEELHPGVFVARQDQPRVADQQHLVVVGCSFQERVSSSHPAAPSV